MMGQNSFVKTAFVFSSALTLSLMVSAAPSFADDVKTPLETPAVEDSVVETVIETVAEPIAVIESDEATAQQATTSAKNSEAAMSEFVKALSSDMAGAQSVATETSETSAETPEEVASLDAPQPAAEVAAAAALEEKLATEKLATEKLATEKLATEKLATEKLATEKLATIEQGDPGHAEAASQPAGALTLGELASVGVDSFTVEADSVPALKAALNSANPLTQLYAADALWTLTSDSDLILPTLISAAASDDLQVRNLATSGLAYLGRRALPAVPVLNQLLGNNDSKTRSIAQATLDIIRSSNRPATTLGIIARESRRIRVVPTAIRAITRLWR